MVLKVTEIVLIVVYTMAIIVVAIDVFGWRP
jgi:hypothetical protein